MYNAPYQGVADDLAKYGRYGDSMLVHMNPIEVGILASLSPTGELTTNPVTGQKEAFLPFLAPLLGSFLGTSLLSGSTLGGLLASGLSKAAAGAIGSGLATTAATGDLKEGILSGITGFGLGKVFGAMGGAGGDATKAVTDAATKSVPQAITPEALNVQPLSAGFKPELSTSLLKTAPAGIEGFLPMSQQLESIGRNLQMPLGGAESVAAAPSSGLNISAGIEELMKPGTFLPIYAGTSVTEGMRQQEELDKLMREQGLSEEEAKRKYEEDARRAIETVQRAYPQMRPKGMAAGGQVEGYYDGGMFSNQLGLTNTTGGFYDTQFGQTSPSDIQSRLRGTVSVAAPYASYGALDVGGSGYLPGIAPEFQYFRQPEEVYPQPPLTMGRGKGGGFGGGYGGGYSSMPGGKGGSYGGGYSGPGFGQYDPYGYGGGYSGYGGGYGSPYGGGYSSMPSKGGYANPSNSMGYGGYNTGSFDIYNQPYSGGYGNQYSNLYSQYSSPYYGGYQDQYGMSRAGNEPGKVYMS